MIGSVLVVCVGNICRSPVGERLLAQRLADAGAQVRVGSAGIGALVGHPADATAAEVAAAHGLALDGHSARQFDRALAVAHELILVMEPGHKHAIAAQVPDVSGRVMLFDQWTGAKGIADPYRHSRDFHERVFAQIDAAATAWVQRLAPRGRG